MAGTIQKRVGKAEVRNNLSSMIEAVNSGAGAIEITDYGQVAAVLMSEHEYQWLCSCANKTATKRRQVRGFFVLSEADALESASRELAQDFEESISKSAKGL